MKSLPKHILEHPKLIPEYRPNVKDWIQRRDGALLCVKEQNLPTYGNFTRRPDKGKQSKKLCSESSKKNLDYNIQIRLSRLSKKEKKSCRYTFPARIIERYLKMTSHRISDKNKHGFSSLYWNRRRHQYQL